MEIVDILTKAKGTVINKVDLVVKYSFDRIASNDDKYRDKQYSHIWSFQTFVGEDRTGEIKVTFKNMPPVDIEAYDRISIVSKNTSRYGMHGIKIDYDREDNKQLIVTQAAKIIICGDKNKEDVTKCGFSKSSMRDVDEDKMQRICSNLF